MTLSKAKAKMKNPSGPRNWDTEGFLFTDYVPKYLANSSMRMEEFARYFGT